MCLNCLVQTMIVRTSCNLGNTIYLEFLAADILHRYTSRFPVLVRRSLVRQIRVPGCCNIGVWFYHPYRNWRCRTPRAPRIPSYHWLQQIVSSNIKAFQSIWSCRTMPGTTFETVNWNLPICIFQVPYQRQLLEEKSRSFLIIGIKVAVPTWPNLTEWNKL